MEAEKHPIDHAVLGIGLVDSLLRPLRVGKEARRPDGVVMISTLGGMALFGINGLIFGPAIAARFLAVWHRVVGDSARAFIQSRNAARRCERRIVQRHRAALLPSAALKRSSTSPKFPLPRAVLMCAKRFQTATSSLSFEPAAHGKPWLADPPTRWTVRVLCGASTVTPSAPAQSRGERPRSTHGIACHTSQMQWRDQRAATDRISLKSCVRRGQSVASREWIDDDALAVTRRLNDSIDRFERAPGRVSWPGERAAPGLR